MKLSKKERKSAKRRRQAESRRAREASGAVVRVLPSAEVKRDAFLATYEWRRMRMVVLKRDGRRCACCGASPETGAVMHVDHIKPRKLFPHLALDPDNLQVLCAACNHGKGNWDMTDFRAPVVVEPEMTEEQREHMRAILLRD